MRSSCINCPHGTDDVHDQVGIDFCNSSYCLWYEKLWSHCCVEYTMLYDIDFIWVWPSYIVPQVNATTRWRHDSEHQRGRWIVTYQSVFNKYIVVQDGYANKESLVMLINKTLYNKGLVDQWGMIHVGLFDICSNAPETWTNFFGACNLGPRTLVPFPGWCKKIEHYLRSNDNFNTKAPIDFYAFLPTTWITCIAKKRRMFIFS